MVRDWENWKRIQCSMEIEGWAISDEQLLEVAKEYEATGSESLAARIALMVKQTGRPLSDVVRAVLAEFREEAEEDV